MSTMISTLEPFIIDKPVQQQVVPTKMLVCTTCKISKLATAEYFYCSKKYSSGFDTWRCMECVREQYYKKTKEEKKVIVRRAFDNSHKSPHRTAFRKARTRVNNKSKCKWLLGAARTPEAEAYIEYLKTVTHCPDCAKEMVWLSYKMVDVDSASFDRIDSGGDYVKENVRIVCLRCNRQKQDSPVDEWVGLLKVRVEKGIIEEVDPRLL